MLVRITHDIKWMCFAEATRDAVRKLRQEKRRALDKRRRIRSGKLTREQAIKLRQSYMDEQEYNGAPSCGGISGTVLQRKDEE